MPIRRSRPPRSTRSVELAPDPLPDHQPLEVADVGERLAVDPDDQVAGAEAGVGGRAVLDDLDYLDPIGLAGLGGEARRQRSRAAGDADVGAPHSALADQFGDDPPRRGVDRDGEAEADAGDGGVDADHAGESVAERAAGVAGIERGIGLDHVLDQARGRAGAGRERAAERGDDAGRDRAAEPVRAADRDDELADPEALGVAEGGRDQVAALDAKDGEVGEGVGSDHLEAELAAVGERCGAASLGPGDDVGGAEHEAVGADRDPAAGAGGPSPAPARAPDGEVGDGGTEALGDTRDGARVGVEGFRVRQPLILGARAERGVGGGS